MLELVGRHGPRFNGVNAATAMHRLGLFARGARGARAREACQVQPSEGADLGAFLERSEAFSGLQARVEELLPEMAPRELSNVLWAHGVMGMCPSARTLEAVEAAATAHLEDFNAADLSSAAHALALLEAPVSAGTLDAFGGHSLALLEDFRPNTLSIVLWAFCQLLAQARARTGEGGGGAGGTGRAAGAQMAAAVDKLLLLAEGTVGIFPGPQLATLLSTYVDCPNPPGDAALEKVSDLLLPQLPSTHMSSVACALRAYASLDWNPGPAMLAAVEQRMLANKGVLPPREAVGLLFSFGKFGYSPSKAGIQKLEQALRLHLPGEGPRALSQAIWAYSKMDAWRPPPDVLAILMEGLLRGAADLDRVGVPMVLYSFARLGYQPSEELLEALHARAALLAPTMDAQGLAHVAWGLVRLRYNPSARLQREMAKHFLAHMSRLEAPGGAQEARAVGAFLLPVSLFLEAHAAMGSTPSEALLVQIDRLMALHIETLDIATTGDVFRSYRKFGHKPPMVVLTKMRNRLTSIAGGATLGEVYESNSSKSTNKVPSARNVNAERVYT